jgi:hypothetical protein
MIEDIAVLRIAANISSAAACSEFWMISSVIGSFAWSVMAASASQRDVDVAEAIDPRLVAGVDDDGGAGSSTMAGPENAMPGSSRSPS